jgi:hypothetical protein
VEEERKKEQGKHKTWHSLVDVKGGDLTLHKTTSSAVARKAAAQSKEPVQQEKSVGFDAGDLVEVMKRNNNKSRKTLQP